MVMTFLGNFLETIFKFKCISFLIIDAALAKICASSVKSRFFNASLSMFRIPSLKTKIVFFSVGLFLCFFKVF